MALHTRVAPAVTPDFRVEDQGTITVLFPVTDAGREWVEQNLPSDAMYFCGGVIIEHRYVQDILFGIVNDGLVVR